MKLKTFIKTLQTRKEIRIYDNQDKIIIGGSIEEIKNNLDAYYNNINKELGNYTIALITIFDDMIEIDLK